MKKITILIFMTICLLLTGCQGNINKTEQKEEKQEKADAAQTEIECEYTWATSHCVYRTEELPDGDDDDEEDDEWQEWLVQCDYQGNVLQKIPEKKFDTEMITFLDVSENEILFSEESDQINVYSVPVIRKDGKEEIAVDKKQLVFENYLDSRFNDFEYIASTKECILFQYDFGDKMAEYDRRSKKFSKIEYNNVPLRDEDGDIIYQNNNDSFVFFATQRSKSTAYHYNYETKKVQEITRDQKYMLYQAGEDKLFFTAVKKGKSSLSYDVYQYDCKNGKKSVLVTEEQIRNVLSEKPEEGMDLIREIAYEDGKVKLEINVKGKGVLLCCDTQTGKLVQEGEGRLQKTQEYPLEKPLTNANQNYNYANDYNVFVQISEDDKSNCCLDEYTLDGKFVRHIFTNNFCGTKYWYLLYVNNEELLFSVSIDEHEYLYTVPLVLVDGSSFPQMEKAEKIVKIEEYDSGLYADKNYIIFADGMSQIHVYDRKKKTFVKVKGIPKTDMNLVTKVGNYFIFDSISYYTTKKGKAEDAFSYYKTGSDQLHIMDPMCDGPIIGDEKRKQVIYARGTKIWTYDLKHKKKECLVKGNKKEDIYEMCIRKDRLYVFTTGEMIDGESTNGYATDVYSYSLEGKDKQLCYEKEFTEALKKFEQENHKNLLLADFSVVNNKIYIRGEADDYYLCYDPDTKQLKQVRKNDPEMLYFFVNKS